MHIRDVKWGHSFGQKPEGRDHSEEPNVCGKITLKLILKKSGVDLFNLAQATDSLYALMNMIMNLWAP